MTTATKQDQETTARRPNDLTIDDIDDQSKATQPGSASGGKKSGSKKQSSSQTEPRPARQQTGPQMHACGLPKSMVSDKKRLIAYTELHQCTHEEREQIDMTDKEKQLYESYQRSAGTIRADRRRFTAALRLCRAGYPERPEGRVHLNTMKVESLDD